MLCFQSKISPLKRKKKENNNNNNKKQKQKLCLAVKQRSIERVESFSDFPLNACDKHLLAHLRAYLYTQDFLARFSLAKKYCVDVVPCVWSRLSKGSRIFPGV